MPATGIFYDIITQNLSLNFEPSTLSVAGGRRLIVYERGTMIYTETTTKVIDVDRRNLDNELIWVKIEEDFDGYIEIETNDDNGLNGALFYKAIEKHLNR